MTREETIELIKRKAYLARKRVLDMAVAAPKAHLTSAYSCVEIVCGLYYSCLNIPNPYAVDRDIFIMSKNHACFLQYAVFADLGWIPVDDLKTFKKNGSRLMSHSSVSFTGMETNGGSLGQGLGIAAGIAYANKVDGNYRLTVCLCGDAELYEGSVWESAMFAGSNELSGLTVIVDRNQLGASDFTENMVKLGDIAAKFREFGFDAVKVDGHNIAALIDIYATLRARCVEGGRPLCIVADTIKGKGLSAMENVKSLHGVSISPDDAEAAYKELEERYAL